MKIGIDGQKLLVDSPAGPEVYTYNIVSALAKTDKNNDYVIFFDKNVPEGYFEKLTHGNNRFSFKVLPSFPSWTQFHLALELLKNPLDVFFTPVHTMPILRSKKTRVVGMIHGLEYISNTKRRGFDTFLEAPIKFLAQKADRLIVPSDYTKNSLLKAPWGVREDKVAVIPEGVDAEFFKRDESETRRILERYGLNFKKYLIAVSTIQPRKNYPRLIEAFSKMSARYPDIKLVVCGKNGWEYEETLEAPKKYGIPGKVVFTGRVTDEDLPFLLSGATLFVNSSLEEGFGLPLLEAMACEIPCAVSDISPFKDIGRGTVDYFDPTDVSSIYGRLDASLKNIRTGENITRIKSAKQRSTEFTWEKAAEKTLEVLTEAF